MTMARCYSEYFPGWIYNARAFWDISGSGEFNGESLEQNRLSRAHVWSRAQRKTRKKGEIDRKVQVGFYFLKFTLKGRSGS